MMDRPLYFRWTFSPQTNSVALSHNGEDHPANIRYHTDLAREIGPDSVHGYAYRIGRGWRLTDWDHRPLDDPYVSASVLRELRRQEGPYHPHPELDWQEVEPQEEPEFNQFHYGLPV